MYLGDLLTHGSPISEQNAGGICGIHQFNNGLDIISKGV